MSLLLALSSELSSPVLLPSPSPVLSLDEPHKSTSPWALGAPPGRATSELEAAATEVEAEAAGVDVEEEASAVEETRGKTEAKAGGGDDKGGEDGGGGTDLLPSLAAAATFGAGAGAGPGDGVSHPIMLFCRGAGTRTGVAASCTIDGGDMLADLSAL